MATQANIVVGRRKESVARVRLAPGTGNITINGRSIDEYFGRETSKMILVELNAEYRPILKKAGFMTRDARAVERKKYGPPGARPRFQYSKR